MTTTSMTKVARDYGMVGPDSRRARETGLADARWFRPPIDPARLQELSVRTDGRAARDTVLWLALIVGFGLLALSLVGSWWAVPAFAAYGALYGGAADSRWHEMGHSTAFKNARLNEAVYYLASFMLLREPTLWRWSHVRHHTDTIIVGRDPEIIFPRPTKRATFLLTVSGFRVVLPMVKRFFKHAAGTVDDDAKDFIPEDEWHKVVWEARAYVVLLTGIVASAVLAGSVLPLLFFGVLPSLYGAWLVVFFGLTQHAGLQEDVLDHRLNTRTVYMNPIFRFLYSNMNYHVEHHIFPTVPYHALPDLHEEIKDHLAPAMPGVVSAYKEILTALPRQAADTSYEVPSRGVPDVAAAPRAKPDAGAHLWSSVETGQPRIDLGSAADIPVGQVRRVDLEGRSLAVYHLAPNDFAATDDLCTHGQASLSEGVVVDCTIECPKHLGRFDVRTGEPLSRPVTVAIQTYTVEVHDGRLLMHSDPEDQSEA